MAACMSAANLWMRLPCQAPIGLVCTCSTILAATELAQTHRTDPVARTLWLDHDKSRNRVSVQTVPLNGSPTFVEVKGPDLLDALPEGVKVELLNQSVPPVTSRPPKEPSTPKRLW